MTRAIDRRHFLEQSMRVAAGVGLASLGGLEALEAAGKPWFKISLAEWSFHRALFSGKMDHLDFAKVAKTDFGMRRSRTRIRTIPTSTIGTRTRLPAMKVILLRPPHSQESPLTPSRWQRKRSRQPHLRSRQHRTEAWD